LLYIKSAADLFGLGHNKSLVSVDKVAKPRH